MAFMPNDSRQSQYGRYCRPYRSNGTRQYHLQLIALGDINNVDEGREIIKSSENLQHTKAKMQALLQATTTNL